MIATSCALVATRTLAATTSNTLVVGIIAAVAVLLSSDITGAVAWRVSSSANRTARELAREDRRQVRLQDAYLTLHLYVDKWGRYAAWRAKPIRMGGTEPELPVVSEAAGGIAALVASDAVAAEMLEFNGLLRAFRNAVGSWETATEMFRLDPRPGNTDVPRASAEISRTASELSAKAEAIHQQMRNELAAD